MGKILKGKEHGRGIYQRKDGLYSAKYYAKNGKRKERYFETLPEAKNSSYDTHLYKPCDEAGIKHFCMHALRYAAKRLAAAIRTRKYQDNGGQICPRYGRLFDKCGAAI